METKLVTIMKPNFIHDDQRGTRYSWSVKDTGSLMW